MKATKAIGLGVALVAATAGAGAAQDAAASLSPGATVRLAEAATGPRLKATVVEVEPGFLLVRTGPTAPPRRIDLSRLHSLEVSRGRHGHARAGAIAGFVPGAIFGALLGAYVTCSEQDSCAPVGGALIGGAIVGTATGTVGALVGWAIQTERWRPLHLPGGPAVRLVPSVAPVRGGMAAGLTLRF